MRKFRAFLILVAVFLIGADIIMSSRGGICPFEGCKIVQESQFSKIYGIDLVYIGLIYFIFMLLLLPLEGLFFILAALGLGFSLYMVFLQFVVLKTICHMCLFVEFVVFLIFISTIKRGRLLYSLLIVLVGFLGTNAAYNFPVYEGSGEAKEIVWYGNGTYGVDFFFDPECNACQRVFNKLQEMKSDILYIVFRPVVLHESSKYKVAVFLKLSKKIGPWEAFVRVKSDNSSSFKITKDDENRALYYSKKNLYLIRDFLKVDAVPLTIVREDSKLMTFIGCQQFEKWFNTLKETPHPQIVIPLDEGLCTPKSCD